MSAHSEHSTVSLAEVHQTVVIPKNVGVLKKLLAFVGPAYLVSVGYMDPGNWATDLEGGARFGYQLIWVSGRRITPTDADPRTRPFQMPSPGRA